MYERGGVVLKKFIKILRNNEDHKPIILKTLKDDTSGYKPLHCAQNSVDYAKKHGGDAIFCFKLWYFPMVSGYIAQVHVIVVMPNGKHVDPTPPEKGDEGKKFICVPSTRIYAGMTPYDVVRFHKGGFEPRMGAVASGDAFTIKQRWFREDLVKASPEQLLLWLAPTLGAVRQFAPWLTTSDLEEMAIVHGGGRFAIEANKLLSRITFCEGEWTNKEYDAYGRAFKREAGGTWTVKYTDESVHEGECVN